MKLCEYHLIKTMLNMLLNYLDQLKSTDEIDKLIKMLEDAEKQVK